MPLFHIQDDDRPTWVIALDYREAIEKWEAMLRKETDMDIFEIQPPKGIAWMCDDDELIL
jgi:hypothetical protein